MTHHSASGLEAGLTEEQIDDLGEYESSPHYDDTELAIIRYSEQLTRDVAVTDEIFEDVNNRFSEREIVELTLEICSANFVNRFNDALEVPLEK